MFSVNQVPVGVASVIAMMLAGCLASMPTQDSKEAQEEINLERVQMGDGSLSCSQIDGQVAKLDKMLKDLQPQQLDSVELAAVGVAGTAAEQTATRMALQSAAQNPSTMQFIPYMSQAVSLVSQKFANDRAIEQQELLKAKGRKEHLVVLYNQRGCRSPANSYNATAKTIQEYLNELGYSCGKPDGLVGPKTVTAIAEFEVTRGLPVTGKATPALLNHLEAEINR